MQVVGWNRDLNCSFNHVSKCPLNRTSWEISVGQFSCNCSGNMLTYHCLATEDGKNLTEGCSKSTLIMQGNCPVFGKEKEISFKSCLSNSLCPNSSYQSNDVYLYPECLNEKRKIYPEVRATKDEYFPIYLIITPLICIVLLVALLMWFIKKRRKRINRLRRCIYRQEMNATLPSELNKIKLLIIGPTSSGKSSTGNTILNKLCFKTGISSSGITFHCKEGASNRFGRNIVVLDTPGFSNLTKGVRRTSLIPDFRSDAVLLVLDLSRFSVDLEKDLQNVPYIFGDNIFDNMFIVFTREDELQRNCISLHDFINTFPDSMLALKEQCHGRIKCVNNLKTGYENTAFVEELVKEIENMKRRNPHD
ncbi:GTPase IMAP family member 8-like [Saccostrea cucullata]|uniref:GTPase IMAP family member 8-like n=1 Tax=Saccostrea cuccullata TaxID=36930 RepID=UPI002ED35120